MVTEQYMSTIEWTRRVWAWMQLSPSFEDAAEFESLYDRDAWYNLGYV